MFGNLKRSNIKSDYRIFTTQKKLILYFFIAVILIFFIFNSIFYRLYSSNIEQIVIKENKSSVAKTCEFTNMILESLEYTADIVQMNLSLQQQIELEPSPNVEQKIFDTVQSISTDTNKNIASIDLYLNSSQKLVTTDYGMISGLSWEIRGYYGLLEKSNERFILTDDYRKRLAFMKDRNYEQITLIRPFYNISTGLKEGLLAINLDKYNLKNIIMGNPDASSIILDDKMNTIISVINEAHIDLPQRLKDLRPSLEKENGEIFFDLNEKKQILVFETSEYTGWKFITVIPASTSMQQMSQLRDYILLLFLVMNIITASVLVFLLTEKVYRKLKKLISSMKEVEKGNFNVSIQDKDKDEFGYMYSSFNNMIGRIRSLFGELYQQKLLQKDAELKLLQSKINPHFIYNIFDNMNWLIQLERYDELESLVDSVSDYYKKSLNAGRDFITISDTVEQLKSYVEIQSIRFRNRFSCKFDFDEEIMSMPILNFMLQPILENAICHGIEPKAEMSAILVKGFSKDDRIYFSIEDDGIGIPPDKLKQINKLLESEQVETDNYFALANINKRIKLFYGAEYGLEITSQETAGTIVTVTIPSNPIEKPEGTIC